jgi:hypothetical protein
MTGLRLATRRARPSSASARRQPRCQPSRTSVSAELAGKGFLASKAARTEQWINRLCPMELIERRTSASKTEIG